MNSLRSRIASAARELYVEEGVAGLSMRRVAERVGVSAPAIYRHFKNKEDLLNEIVAEGLRILETYLRPALEGGTPYERLEHMSTAYLDFALEQPRYFDFAFLLPNPHLGHVAEELHRQEWGTFRGALEQVRACIEQGLFPGEDALEVAISIWAEVHGLITLYRTGRLGLDQEQFRAIYRQSVTRTLRGLTALTEPGRTPR
jgi:AcrR family transcriptional regulator